MCLGTRDAVGPFIERGRCCYDVCGGLPVPCGRPLLVAGAARVADGVARADWTADVGEAVRAAAPAARAWAADAAMEHASIASFAKLALELLAASAPATLVAKAHDAALDEIEHARICFALAGRRDGSALGAARLSLEGLELARDLSELAVETARQSCVGETVAALALEAAADACAPELAPLLRAMAADELRHAALGWEVVGWACARGGDAVRERVLAALIVDGVHVGAAPVAWRRAGRLDPRAMGAVLAGARSVVTAGADALAAAPTVA